MLMPTPPENEFSFVKLHISQHRKKVKNGSIYLNKI
jgi:hypothetical protein